jgi:hypothetical protein
MSGAEETFLDPDAAANGAARLTSTGDNLHTRFVALAARLDTLNGAHPWGNDKPGQTFNKEYLADGGDAPAKLVLDAGKKTVDIVAQLGPKVKSAVDGTVEVDDLVKKWFDTNK